VAAIKEKERGKKSNPKAPKEQCEASGANKNKEEEGKERGKKGFSLSLPAFSEET
jgi:hypothetical protein